MQGHISAICDVIREDVEKGQVVDIDAYCRMFTPVYPQLTRRQLQDSILEAVTVCGGGAVWGVKPSKGNKPERRIGLKLAPWISGGVYRPARSAPTHQASSLPFFISAH